MSQYINQSASQVFTGLCTGVSAPGGEPVHQQRVPVGQVFTGAGGGAESGHRADHTCCPASGEVCLRHQPDSLGHRVSPLVDGLTC